MLLEKYWKAEITLEEEKLIKLICQSKQRITII